MCTDCAALLPQTLEEVLELMSEHIELKRLEAQNGTEYRFSYIGGTPVMQEFGQRAGRPAHELLHIQKVGEHHRLMEQAVWEPSDSLPPAAPSQGQAAWPGRHEAQHAWQPCVLPAELACHTALSICQGFKGLVSIDKVGMHGLSVKPQQKKKHRVFHATLHSSGWATSLPAIMLIGAAG